jgi:hypothetical protein
MFLIVSSILRSSKSFITTTTTTTTTTKITSAKIINGSHQPTAYQQRYGSHLLHGAHIPATSGRSIHPTKSSSRLFSSTSDDIASMRAGEIKKELESYGIPTVSFVEKSELVEALENARAQGLKPKKEPQKSTANTTTSSKTSSKREEKVEPTRPREERLAEEMEKCSTMKAGELKKELQERGISTASFFEKSDFVKALAEARVDNVTKGGGGSDEEGYAEYTNVEVLTDDSSGPRQRTAENQQSARAGSPFGGGASSPFGGASPFGASPFGGAAGMGGMGGMGGIADMLKNMGMGGAGVGSPFGSGANPFGGMGGDAMGKAQELMKNPKVMELMMKAQGNPKIMAAMQECMSNPAAFAKYQNDPEISGLIIELKKYV